MRKKLKKIVIVLVVYLLGHSVTVQAQGCSDAGFCSIGALSQQPGLKEAKQKLSIQLPFGMGDESVMVFTPAVQYDNRLNEKWSIQAKITGNYANGNLASVAGLGDLYLAGTYVFPGKKNNWNFATTLGTKIPLSQSNLKENNRSLPMQYQSSLGTVDLITGIALSNAKWQFAAGWQQPLTGTNGNQFLPFYWSGNTDAAKYIPSNDFKRKADLLLRSLYKQKIGERFSLHGGLLGIYHTAEDSYIDANISNKPIDIKGSAGLTLNATLAAWFNVSSKLQIGIMAGAPLVVRDFRPDGLTRSFVLSPEISWNF